MDVAGTVSPTFQHRHILILASSSHEKEPVLASDSDEEYAKWKDALHQAVLDVTAWKFACREEMKIVNPIPKRLPSMETKTLYDSVEVTLSPLTGKIFVSHIFFIFRGICTITSANAHDVF